MPDQDKPTRRASGQRPPASEALIPAAESGAPAQFLQEDDTLLERSRVYWQTGEWDKLAALADENLESYPDRAKLSLLAAVGFSQSGDMSRARRHARLAQDWGCDRELLARVLIGGVYNSLGRAASLQGDEESAQGHFETSVGMVSPRSDTRVLGRARNLREKARLGMLPEAIQLMGEELADQPQRPAQDLERAHDSLRHIKAIVSAQAQTQEARPLALAEILDQAALDADALPQKRIFVCGHHKAGTNFLLPVFREIAKQFDLDLWLKFYDDEPDLWDICLHQHARVADVPERENFSGVHLIRHPMGLIYSAALYHEKCKEPWAHMPMQRFTDATFRALSSRATYNVIKDPAVSGAEKQKILQTGLPGNESVASWDSGYDFAGRTYAQMLKSFERIEDKILFEMRAFSRGVVQDMVNFPADQRFFRLKLEEVSHDDQMTALQGAVRHLGFGGAHAATCLAIAARHSLWNIPRPSHATTGVSGAWEQVFQGDVEKEFRTLFGWAESALGYESPPG